MKNAICAGINDYPGTDLDLSGCVNDARDWAEALRNRGFEARLILDSQATKVVLLREIRSLIAASVPGDWACICYSGHGTQVPDQSGDEPDHYDEAICPHDVTRGQLITDDELAVEFEALQAGVRLVVIADSCFSGTVTRLLDPIGSRTTPRVRSIPFGRIKKKYKRPKKGPAGVGLGIGSPGVSLLMAASGEHEYSYDASFNNRPNGAFTRIAIDVLESLSERATFGDWQRSIRMSLPSVDYPQRPQLVGTKAMRQWRIFD